MGKMLRCIGKTSPKRSFFQGVSIGHCSRPGSLWSGFGSARKPIGSDGHLSQQLKLQKQQQRFKSSIGAISTLDSDSDDEELVVKSVHNLDYAHSGHAAGADVRASNHSAKTDPWKINLGRGTDNAWLMGPRNEHEWYTGVAPVNGCPGTLCNWNETSVIHENVPAACLFTDTPSGSFVVAQVWTSMA